jgi:putative membrane protein
MAARCSSLSVGRRRLCQRAAQTAPAAAHRWQHEAVPDEPAPDADRPTLDRTAAWRDYLANERTYLAWLRSALAVLALGLAAARFGGRGGVEAGAILTAVAIAGLVFGSVRYQRGRRTIASGVLPGGRGLAPIVAGAVLVASFLLAFLVFELAG